MPRSAHSSVILGPELHSTLRLTRVLVVGAGGIGCELGNVSRSESIALLNWELQVKNLVLAGFEDITIIDLDTIELSNLNRQFLFRKTDVKQAKAAVGPLCYVISVTAVPSNSQVAARSASDYNASCKITPIHGNIKEPSYDVSWFKSHRIVLNALDNIGDIFAI